MVSKGWVLVLVAFSTAGYRPVMEVAASPALKTPHGRSERFRCEIGN
jgi:hypothetical protein